MGVLRRFRRIVSLLGVLVGNRVELFSIEIREEFERQCLNAVLLLACCVLAGLGLLFASLAILILGWQGGYLLTSAGVLAGVFLLVALGLVLILRWRIQAAPLPFSATVEAFAKDAAVLYNKPAGGSE